MKRLYFSRFQLGLILFSITIGTSSLILLFSINEASKMEIKRVIEDASNPYLISLWGVAYKGKQEQRERTILSYGDLTFLKNNCQEVKGVALEARFFGFPEKIKVGKKEYPPSNFSLREFISNPMIGMVGIVGITPEFRKVKGMKLQKGRFINKADMLLKRRVCVLGGKLYEWFGNEEVLGKKLSVTVSKFMEEGKEKEIKGEFTVVGGFYKKMGLYTTLPGMITLAVRESQMKGEDEEIKFQRKMKALEENWTIYLPSTTFSDFEGENFYTRTSIFQLLHSSLPESSDILIKIDIPKGRAKLVKVEEEKDGFSLWPELVDERVKEVISNISRVLKKRYGKDKHFYWKDCGSLREEIEMQEKESKNLFWITSIFTLLLSGIISGTTMLLSTYKRRSEIGVRRAFGARKKDIFFQFLQEGVYLYSIGIIVGVIIGITASYLFLVKILSWEFSIPFYGIILSIMLPSLTGILSSLYPAMKAATIPPAYAVKYE